MRKLSFGLVTLALVAGIAAPSAVLAYGEEEAKADEKDMDARMQEKLSGKLGTLNTKVEIGDKLDGKLSDRVNEKNSEMDKKLDAQSEALTAADRSKNGDDDHGDEEMKDDGKGEADDDGEMNASSGSF